MRFNFVFLAIIELSLQQPNLMQNKSVIQAVKDVSH